MKKKKVTLVAVIVILLAAIVPSAALANWCGPNAPSNACGECPNGWNSECGNSTCFAEKPAACKGVVPHTKLVEGSFTANSFTCSVGYTMYGTMGVSYVTAVEIAANFELENDPCPPRVAKALFGGYKIQIRRPR